MDLLKALKRTTYLSAAVLLALGATEARAAEGVAYLGHMSASVTGLLNITETSPMRFGNFSVTCAGGGGACAVDDATLTLATSGQRSVTGGSVIVPLTGAGSTQGVATGSPQETGSQQPGFFDITTGEGQQDIYITFADESGNIIDSNGDNVHPDNHATLTKVGGTDTFTVNDFTFVDDDSTTGYVDGGTYDSVANPPYGHHITTSAGGTARIRVGATLHTAVTAGAYPAGRYEGTYYIMASY